MLFIEKSNLESWETGHDVDVMTKRTRAERISRQSVHIA
jgi:hypothetical protein